jgi:hypothetical protein
LNNECENCIRALVGLLGGWSWRSSGALAGGLEAKAFRSQLVVRLRDQVIDNEALINHFAAFLFRQVRVELARASDTALSISLCITKAYLKINKMKRTNEMSDVI